MYKFIGFPISRKFCQIETASYHIHILFTQSKVIGCWVCSIRIQCLARERNCKICLYSQVHKFPSSFCTHKIETGASDVYGIAMSSISVYKYEQHTHTYANSLWNVRNENMHAHNIRAISAFGCKWMLFITHEAFSTLCTIFGLKEWIDYYRNSISACLIFSLFLFPCLSLPHDFNWSCSTRIALYVRFLFILCSHSVLVIYTLIFHRTYRNRNRNMMIVNVSACTYKLLTMKSASVLLQSLRMQPIQETVSSSLCPRLYFVYAVCNFWNDNKNEYQK